jgi:hypothetical protein
LGSLGALPVPLDFRIGLSLEPQSEGLGPTWQLVSFEELKKVHFLIEFVPRSSQSWLVVGSFVAMPKN